MRDNDTLTVKRHVNPMIYLVLLQTHRQQTAAKTFRLESLGSATATLIKLAQMLQLSGIAFKTSVKMKFRRMTLNSGNHGPKVLGQDINVLAQSNCERTEICKNMECMKIEMQFFDS